ncbi:hypothetical protein Calag_1056 [Caldisphaera lagunensis DSM 15908]|uniref:Uncharacterized protein n=1 Tax=Caldisphaera lagunensis (strain DSM 15908 / JCM 11604 / ANMR 0165 / IC-154) TaxID=1056495 RepID=L0AA47_CALLD|nr:hypothetical protein [Caldisphaera lagunensis]AFZ70778.1 hypothetical protein Calag_1056 [Caldisphaera lagunensis DSM 15908]
MLSNRLLAIAIIFSFFILSSFMFSIYGINNKTDQAVLVKTNMSMLYYEPYRNPMIVFSNNSKTIIVNRKQFEINGLNSISACSYKENFIALSGYYNNIPSIAIFNGSNYTIYLLGLHSSPNYIYCLNNGIVFTGLNNINPYIAFLNFSNNQIKLYQVDTYLGTPSSLYFYNNTFIITFNNNNVLLFKNNSYVISFPSSISIDSIFAYNSLYFAGSISNNTTNGFLFNSNNRSYIIGLNNYQGFIGAGVDNYNGYSLLYRPYSTWSYLITIIENKYVYTTMIGLSYPFTLNYEGHYDKGLWFTGEMTIGNNDYQAGFYINGTLNGDIGYKLPIGYTLSNDPIVSKGFIKEINISYQKTYVNTTKINIQFNKTTGSPIITNDLKIEYLNFYINKYIILGESLLVSIFISLIIYCVLAKNYNWNCF